MDEFRRIMGMTDKASAPKAIPSYDPMDAAIRTIYAEASPKASREERQAIASVIVNRAATSGRTFDQVVQEPGQFEPWSDPKARARLDALKPSDPTYKAIQADVADILAGKSNPHPSLTNFYAPKAQAALGRERPAFDDGKGQQIGDHLFFAAQGPREDDFRALMGMAASKAAKLENDPLAAPPEDAKQPSFIASKGGKIVFDDSGEPIPEGQARTVRILAGGGAFDENAPMGSRKRPYVLRGDPAQLPAGSYYIDADPKGTVRRVPGGEKAGVGERLASGLGRGVADVAQSVAELAPGTEDSAVLQALQANQKLYDADNKGDLVAGTARFGGQLLATVPAMAAGEGALAASGAARALGPVGTFLTGKAGGAVAKGAPVSQRVASRLLQGGSVAARGAQEGAAASALTSSANDAPLSEQVATGALLGGAVGAAVPAVTAAGRAVVGNKLVGGIEPAEQVSRLTQAQGLPVPVPQTAGQLSGSPSQQLLENSMLKGASGTAAERIMKEHGARATAALQENVPAIQGRLAGRALEPGEGAAMAQAKLAEMEYAAAAEVNQAYNAAREVGTSAMLESGRGPREAMQEALGAFDPKNTHLANVMREVERFGDDGAPTARELFEARQRLSALRGSSNSIEAKAAGSAIRGLDGYIDKALTEDLFLGDPKAIGAWRTAIQKRAEYGRLFEGDDLIDKLTATGRHGEGTVLKVAPDEAVNYILGRSKFGAIGKKNLARDLDRMKDVLGPKSEEWNALRGDVFAHIAKASRGSVDASGESTFSGQKFANAWRNFKEDSPQIVSSMFSPEERKLIDDFSEVAVRTTVPVKGGDNPSNSAIAAKVFLKKTMDSFWTTMGAAGGAMVGGAAGGPVGTSAGAGVGAGVGKALDAFFRDVKSIKAATKATSYAPVVPKESSGLVGKLLKPAPAATGAIGGDNLLLPNNTQAAVP